MPCVTARWLFLSLRTLMVLALTVCCAGAPSWPSPGSSESGPHLREIVAAGRLAELRWPDFSDYQVHIKNFYEPSGYQLAWIRAGVPTAQARSVIEALQQADNKGLNSEDYDGPLWTDRLARMQQSPSSADQAMFDVALTVCVMRYVSDLRIGKINPRHFRFNLDVGRKKYDLPLFPREKLVGSIDVQAQLAEAEPPFPGYKRTLDALQRYLALAHQDDRAQLPVPPKPVEPRSPYDGIPRLTHLLSLLGDLPADAAVPEAAKIYDGALVAAVKDFQTRHGLAADGRLGAQTVNQLNVPLSSRVEQIRLTLERWRWVPYEFSTPPIVVNIPEFRLRAFEGNGKIALQMNVIVGRAYRHETPVFERDMKYVVFRPYWNVPRSILRSEIMPAVRGDRGYIAKKNYEVITPQGVVVPSGEINDDVLARLGAGNLMVRQKPGPSNALGLVKLMFPNEYSVYLHSTPSPQLFSQSRRDFSHGCIRVEHPAELAAWVLRNNSEWSLDRVRAAMQSGKDNVQVNLTEPVPVLILYGTAVVDDQGRVHFFEDIYGFDAKLKKALVKGYPYPG